MAMSRKELEQQLLALQDRNRRLHSQVQVQEKKNSELKSKLRATVATTDLEEEHISNSLIRRLDSMHRERDELAKLLRDEEHRKTDQEAAWLQLKRNRASLEQHLRAEDHEIRDKLERQLAAVQRNRQLMAEKVEAESNTLQQLQLCIRSFREVSSNASTPTKVSTPHVLPTHGDAHEASASQTEWRDEGSEFSGKSPVRSVETPSSRPPSTIPRDSGMLRLLETEILKAEALHKETMERLNGYQRRIAELQQRVAEAEAERDAQRDSVETVREELHRTSTAVNEIHANQEVFAEWTIDRELLAGAHGGSGVGLPAVRSSSACSSVMSTRTVETTASDWPERTTPRVLHKN